MGLIRRSLVILAVITGPASAQQYVPATDLPNGKEIVAIYVGAQSCGPCHSPEVKTAVRQMKTLVAGQAQKSGAAFSVMGVANDWDHTVALAFLADVGPFDQQVIGGNWTNLAIERYIWRDPNGNTAMPQIIVLERTVTPGRSITFTEPKIIRRVLGAKDIPEWVAKGAPIIP